MISIPDGAHWICLISKDMMKILGKHRKKDLQGCLPIVRTMMVKVFCSQPSVYYSGRKGKESYLYSLMGIQRRANVDQVPSDHI